MMTGVAGVMEGSVERGAHALHRSSWYRVNLGLLLATLLDPGIFSGPLRHLPLVANLLVFGGQLWTNRLRVIRPHGSAWWLGFLVLYGGIGVLENKLSGATNGFLTVFGLLLIPLLAHATPVWRHEIEFDPIVRDLCVVGLLALAGIIASNLMHSHGLIGASGRTHERTYILFAVPIAAQIGGLRRLSLATLVLAIVLVVIDRRATGVIILGCSGALWFALHARSRLRSFLILGCMPFFIVGAWIGFPALREMNRVFKEGVGSVDNTQFREHLVGEALDRIRANPLVGDRFSGPQGIDTGWSMATEAGYVPVLAPYHSDYLQMLGGGGWLGLFLFGGFLGAAVFESGRDYFGAGLDKSPSERGVRAMVLLVLINYSVIILFNPVLGTVQTAFSLSFIVGLHFVLYRVRQYPHLRDICNNDRSSVVHRA